MKFIDGKFKTKRGKQLRVKFGDKAQLELMRQLNEVHRAVAEGDYHAHITEEVMDWREDSKGRVNFLCLCGRGISYTFEYEHDFQKKPHTLKCYCGKCWTLKDSIYSEFELLITLKKTKKPLD